MFEEASVGLDKKDFQLLSNYIVSDIASLGEKGLSINSEHLSGLISMFVSGEISSRGVKDILNKMIETGEDPKIIADKNGLFQKSNEEELIKVVNSIIFENKEVVVEYRNGKISALQFLIGQGMKATKGSANPNVLKELILKVI